jgi:O-antigen ligase/tetratricopeptide (TPR) repeat protein
MMRIIRHTNGDRSPRARGDGTAEAAVCWVLFAILATPLVFAHGFVFPFVIPKAFYFQALATLVLVILAIDWIRDRGIVQRSLGLAPARAPFLWAMLVFVGVATVSAILGEAPQRSLFGTLERRWGVLGWALLLGIYLALRVYLDDRGWWWALRIVAGVGVAVSAFALVWEGGILPGKPRPEGWSRLSSTVGNPGYLGAYLVLGMSTAAYLAVSEDRTTLRVLWAGAVLLQLAVFLMTGTRAATLGAFVGIAVVALVSVASDTWIRDRRWLAAAVVLIMAGGGLFFVIGDTPSHVTSWWQRLLTTLSTETNSARLRLLVWNAGLEGVWQAPWLGVGLGNFDLVWSRHFDPLIYHVAGSTSFDRAHNVFVEAMVTTGLLGLIAFIALWVALGWMLVRAWREGDFSGAGAACFGIGFVAYLVYLMFWFEDYSSITTFTVMAGFVGHRASAARQDEAARRGTTTAASSESAGGALDRGGGETVTHDTNSAPTASRVVVAGILLAVSVVTIQHNMGVLGSAREAWKGEYSMDAWEGGELYQSALARHLPGDHRILGGYLGRLTFLARHGRSGAPEGATHRMKDALSAAEQALAAWRKRDPHNPDVYVTRSRLCGLKEEVFAGGVGRTCARQALERAVDLSPGQVRYRHWLADHHLSAGDPERALEALDEALEVYGSFGETYYYQARVYWRTGEFEEAVRHSRLATSLGWGGQPSAFVEELAKWLVDEGRSAEAAQLVGDHLSLRYPGLRRPKLTSSPGKGFQPWDLQLAGRLPVLHLQAGDADDAIQAAEFLAERLPASDHEDPRKERIERFIEDVRLGRFGPWTGVESVVEAPATD